MLKQTLFSILLLLFFLTLVSGLKRGRMVGTRIDIKDVKSNKEIQELGKFSVDEYNKGLHTTTTTASSVVRGGDHGGSNGSLTFVEVVEAQRQVVSGIKYYLKVEAMQGESRTFDAVVVVKPWVQSKKLLNFGLADPRLNVLETPSEVF